MSRKISFGEVAKRLLDDSIHAARSRAMARGGFGTLTAYGRLLDAARSRTELLSRSAAREAWAANRALLAMALHHHDWLEMAESWAPRPASSRDQLSSLAEHLFARFPLPAFMTSVWLDGEPGVRTREQDWYKRLGQGESIRRLDVPLRITRGMAHRLLGAPRHLGMVAALRWTQLMELGASDALVRAVLATRLARVLEDEELWEEVLPLLVSHAHLPAEQIAAIVEFIAHEKIAIEGRSCTWLLRVVQDWHRNRGRRRGGDVSWARAPFGDFTWHDPEGRLWTITELCTSRALFLEGKLMRHCVGTYVRACVRRQTSIWSMQMETSTGSARVLTIGVDLPGRRLIQARRKQNASPSPFEKLLVRRWAEKEGIAIPQGLRDLQ